MAKVKTCMIGCGAVASVHIPLMTSTDTVEPVALVDKSLDRAKALADEHGIPEAAGSFDELSGEVDAVLVALPHHLHAPVTVDVLRKGKHVLVEKPMALTVAECDAMIAAAKENDRILAVGMGSRFFHGARFVKRLLENGVLGEIRRFDIREGFVYEWPVTSDFMFRREAGGGVLADTGAHVLDMALWLLGDYAELDYRDDSEGGVEADCELRMKMKSGAEGICELSRTRNLRNTWILEGERATLELERKFNPKLSLRMGDQELELSGHVTGLDGEEEEPIGCFRRQLEDFADAVLEGREPFVTGEEGRRVVALIEECHANRRPLELSWRAR